MRTVELTVQVADPAIAVNGIVKSKPTGPAGCVNALQVVVNMNVLKIATYAFRIELAAFNNITITFGKSQAFATGAATSTAVLDIKDIKLSGLCTAPIELQPQLSVTPVLKQGFIGSLDVAFPVRVNTADFYQISLKTVGQIGDDIALINASRFLNAGNNHVTVNVPSEKFAKTDGPYKVVSLLVVSGANSARRSTVGSSGLLMRWQFYPKINGDLTGDGAVDAADSDLTTKFRGVRAAVPGARRDLNKDRVIDIRDGREVQNLRCAVGACKLNP